MADIAEFYPIPSPLKPSNGVRIAVPESVWTTHAVIYVYSALVLARSSVPAQTYCLAERGSAERLVARGMARWETEQERQVALDNKHQRFVGGAPKSVQADAERDAAADRSRAKKPAKAKAKADGKSG